LGFEQGVRVGAYSILGFEQGVCFESFVGAGSGPDRRAHGDRSAFPSPCPGIGPAPVEVLA